MPQIALIKETEADRQALHTLSERCAREARGGECTVHSFTDSDYFNVRVIPYDSLRCR